jgi:hypothetical protein
VKDDENKFWGGQGFPSNVDELYFQVTGVIKDVGRLKQLFDLFAETLDELCRMGLRLNSRHASKQLLNFLLTHVLRLLSLLVKGMHRHEDKLCQTNGNVLASRPSGLVLVQHDDDLAVAFGVLADQFLLWT